jgi:hypothetical protein
MVAVQRAEGGALSLADTGSIDIVLAAGRLTATFAGGPSGLAARSQGPYSLTCSVPPSMLAGDSAGLAQAQRPGTMGTVTVADDKFATDFCKPFARLR